MKVFGIIGWKNSGKTSLVARLVTELRIRGFTVSTIKHAHHNFDLDQPGRDSFQHREAGAQEVLISSKKRWAIMHELQDQEEMSLQVLLPKMSRVDFVLIEGYKSDDHPKIECHRATSQTPLICADDKTILAVATDHQLGSELPIQFDLDDTAKIADFVIENARKI